jgi:hypothetical protein
MDGITFSQINIGIMIWFDVLMKPYHLSLTKLQRVARLRLAEAYRITNFFFRKLLYLLI